MVVKWILRYLRGTTNQALCFGGSNIYLQGYVDADMAGDRDNIRRTTGYVLIVGGNTVTPGKTHAMIEKNHMQCHACQI